ncbi:MAG: hypothetical protein OXT67_02830, partial [Zetaproteobacteria bacterium]|nr:hypothetical protein [Zetaproteobacteria bacterium]
MNLKEQLEKLVLNPLDHDAYLCILSICDQLDPQIVGVRALQSLFAKLESGACSFVDLDIMVAPLIYEHFKYIEIVSDGDEASLPSTGVLKEEKLHCAPSDDLKSVQQAKNDLQDELEDDDLSNLDSIQLHDFLNKAYAICLFLRRQFKDSD